MTDPGGNAIYYNQRQAECQGLVGVLDLDANAHDADLTEHPQENIYWEKAPTGAYRVQVLLYKRRTDAAKPIPFEVTVFRRNERLLFPGQLRREHEQVMVAEITFNPSESA